MAVRRRSMEEKNLKILRELAALPANKQCFDCHQRGPTYINMTIGSFVCTSCSGILRGLTPPHRVKSITMTTFSMEEIDILKSRGNEYCRYVWMGTYDSSTCSTENDIKDDHKKRDLMSQKYEKKRWYVDPEIATTKLKHDLQFQPKQNVPYNSNGRGNFSRQITQVPEVKPLSQLFGKMPAAIVIDNNQSAENWPQPVSSATAQTVPTMTSTSHSFDFLAELSGSSTVPRTNAPGTLSTANGNFANFDTAFSMSQKPVAATATVNTATLPASMSVDSYSVFALSSKDNIFSPPPGSTVPSVSQQSAHDRYAALADLDSSFNQSTSVTSPSWSVKSSSSTASIATTDSNFSSGDKNLFTTAPSNPFSTTSSMWSSQFGNTNSSNMPQNANPFQKPSDGMLPFHQSQSNQGLSPLPIVGNSPTEDCFRTPFPATNNSFFATSFNTASDMSSTPNGFHGGQFVAQNGEFPSVGRQAWGITPSPSLPLTFATSQPPLVAENSANDLSWHSDQMPNPANPFAGFHGVTGPHPSQGNPFL